MRDTVDLLPSTAEALDELVCPVARTNPPEPIAWLWFVLREMPDTPERFPHGKWATLQHIESQLRECAALAAQKEGAS
jgi:hypothetical protein